MALLGSSVDPRLFMQDFSGFTRAADIQAQGMANLGGQIGSGIQKYGEAKAERKKLDAGIKATVTGIESAIKMGKSLGIDVESSLSPFLEKINDPNVSPMEAAAYAQQASNSISNVLNFGIKAQDQASEANKLKLDAAYKNEQLKIAQQNANSRAQTALASGNAPPSTLDVPIEGGTQKMQWDAKKGSYVPINVSGLLESDQSGTEGNLLNLVKGLEGFNPRAYGDYKQTSVGYGTKGTEGEILTEPEAAERLKTELSGHAKRIQDAAKLKGVSLSQNQFDALTSFDFNTGRGADLISRFGDKPEELIAKMQEYTKAGGKELPGLVKRRGVEAALFMTPSDQPALQPQSRVGFKADAPSKEVKIITGDQAKSRNLDPAGTYEESYENGKLVGIQSIIAPPSVTQLAQVEKSKATIEESKAEIQKAKRSKEIALKTIKDYVNEEGKPTERLDKAVGYGEAFATGVAEYVPIIGTQSGETRSDQQRLNRLVETDILEAASLLKPVSNTDLLMLIKNRPTVTQPKEVWTKYFSDIREILSNEENYTNSIEKPESTPKTQGQLLREEIER